MLTQPSQAHYVVMGPCKMQKSCLGLFVHMENALRILDVDATSTELILDKPFVIVLHRCSMHDWVCLHEIRTTVPGRGLA